MSQPLDNMSQPKQLNLDDDNPQTQDHNAAPKSNIESTGPISTPSDTEPNKEIHKRKRKFTSDVWYEFERKKIDGLLKAICMHCKKQLVGDSTSGTSHLRDHLKNRCPKRKNMSVPDIFQKHIKIEEGGGEKMKIVNYTFDQEVSRRDLVNMVIAHEYPLAIVEHKFFRKFISGICPSFKLISRNTLHKDVIKFYDAGKGKTMGLLKRNRSRIAITTDMWTAQNQRKGFMAITAHWVDDSWTLQNRVLR